MAHPTIEKHYAGAGTYRITWRKDGQADFADKVVASVDELEATVDRWAKMGYHVTSINMVAAGTPAETRRGR